MSGALVPSLQARRGVLVRKLRELPVPGEILLTEGSPVGAEDLVGRAWLPGDPEGSAQ